MRTAIAVVAVLLVAVERLVAEVFNIPVDIFRQRVFFIEPQSQIDHPAPLATKRQGSGSCRIERITALGTTL